MYKKIMKTILLIVFVVFLGVKNVNADEKIARKCVYNFPSSKDWPTIVVQVTASYGVIVDKFGSEYVMNWGNSVEGFKGYDYFSKNNQSCPPNAVIVDVTGTGNEFYFSDSIATSDKIKKYALNQHSWSDDDDVYYGYLATESSGDGQHGDGGEGKTTIQGCSCSNKTVSFSFKFDDKLSNPHVKVMKGSEKVTEASITNWKNQYHYDPANPFGKDIYFDSYYSYIADDYPKNKCPDYAIVGKGVKNPFRSVPVSMINVSDKTNLDILEDNADYLYNDVYTLTCKAITPEPPKSNENSNSNPVSNEPIIDPSVDNPDPLNYDFSTYSCGNEMVTGIPKTIPKFGKFLYNFLQFLVPIALILLGTIDMIKSIVGAKEDDIKKNQQLFIKRLVIAAVVFFSFAIAKLLISVVAENSNNVIDCIDCILRFSENCVGEA